MLDCSLLTLRGTPPTPWLPTGMNGPLTWGLFTSSDVSLKNLSLGNSSSDLTVQWMGNIFRPLSLCRKVNNVKLWIVLWSNSRFWVLKGCFFDILCKGKTYIVSDLWGFSFVQLDLLMTIFYPMNSNLTLKSAVNQTIFSSLIFID